jgi:5-deoxy-glucuronate isomerase
MRLLRRTAAADGYRAVVRPGAAGLKYLSFGVARLVDGRRWASRTGREEAVLVILGGRCDVSCGGRNWRNLGQRENVFEGRATAVYIPPGKSFSVQGAGQAELAVCRSAAEDGGGEALAGQAYVVGPDEVESRIVGAHNWRRRVEDIVGAGKPARRLLVGETYNEPGAWSSYPPHKHDVNAPPDEVKMEEVYHFRVNPRNGFGVQRIYTADGEIEEVYAVREGDTVIIPRGYHPVAAAPGYAVYYLWILAGEERKMRPRDDPQHAWVKELEKD